MTNIPYKKKEAIQLPNALQRQRVHRVIQEKLTQAQREVLFAYYFQELTLSEIARYRGVSKSTVWKILHRAEQQIQQYLQY